MLFSVDQKPCSFGHIAKLLVHYSRFLLESQMCWVFCGLCRLDFYGFLVHNLMNVLVNGA